MLQSQSGWILIQRLPLTSALVLKQPRIISQFLLQDLKLDIVRVPSPRPPKKGEILLNALHWYGCGGSARAAGGDCWRRAAGRVRRAARSKCQLSWRSRPVRWGRRCCVRTRAGQLATVSSLPAVFQAFLHRFHVALQFYCHRNPCDFYLLILSYNNRWLTGALNCEASHLFSSCVENSHFIH